MKQNSRIVFHFTRKLLKTSYLVLVGFLLPVFSHGQEKPEYLTSFDPAKGFKPAQRDLSEVFLQIAGSLEAYGSPEPYLRHIAAEHTRIETLYRQKFAKDPKSLRPAFLTEDYLNGVTKNWNFLAAKLDLESLAKEAGRDVRRALLEDHSIAAALAEDQKRVIDSMAGKSGGGSDFDSLQRKLEQSASVAGPASRIRERTDRLFQQLDQGLSASDAQRVKTFITSVFIDTGKVAQSEAEAALVEWAIKSPPNIRYDAANEDRLTQKEREALAALLSNNRFTRADFPRLDAFYKSSAYDRLSERGKDELSRRAWEGTR